MSDMNTAAGNDHVTGRIALGLMYKGSAYCGWQSQKSGVPSVQAELEVAISRVANHPVEVVCAGRTDKAVHASYQVVHFDTTSVRTARSWVFGCNANLPPDISVSWVQSVSDEFHARFSAFNRRYNYVIFNHPIRPAHFYDEMTWCHYALDESLMHRAAQCLVGEHDFTSFRAVGCQSKSPFRHIDHVRVNRFGNILVLDIQGNAFLHHMVRNIAGVLMSIGAGRNPVEWCAEVLAAKDRTKADVTAQPYGLFLTDVGYPDQYDLPRSGGAPSLIQAMLAMSGSNKVDWDVISPADMWDIARPGNNK